MLIVTLGLTSSIYISLLNLLGYLRSNKYHIFVTFSVCHPSIQARVTKKAQNEVMNVKMTAYE